MNSAQQKHRFAKDNFHRQCNRGLRHTPCWKTKQYNLSPLGNEMQKYFIALPSNMAYVVGPNWGETHTSEGFLGYKIVFARAFNSLHWHKTGFPIFRFKKKSILRTLIVSGTMDLT